MRGYEPGSFVVLGAMVFVGCGPGPTVSPTPAAVPPATADDRDSAPTHEAPLEAALAAEPAAEPAAAAAPEQAMTLQPLDWTGVEGLIGRHAGKIVVVDVWSTSCDPCLREFPHLVALQKQYPEDVVCISLNCDYIGLKKKPPESYTERVATALAGMNARSIVNVLCTMPSDDLFDVLKISSIPAVFVYDRQGQKVHTFNSRTPAAEGEGISYEQQVAPAVAELVGR